jgi:ferredoxin
MDSDLSYAVVIGNTGEAYRCRATQTLLAGMEALTRQGIPVGCRGGGCGVCKVRVESGMVRTARMSRARLSVEEEAAGFVLACQAYPQSDVRVRAVGRLATGVGHDERVSFLARSLS